MKKNSKTHENDYIDKSFSSEDYNSSDTSFDSFSGDKYGKEVNEDDTGNSGSDTINSSSDLSDGSETSFDNFGKPVPC